ncbi:hypothetical protein Hanom_Chr15g01349861 [Helianthus anomalus]
MHTCKFSKLNRLMKVVFNTRSLFDGFKRSRDTCNHLDSFIDLFGMIKLHLETYIRSMNLGSS